MKKMILPLLILFFAYQNGKCESIDISVENLSINPMPPGTENSAVYGKINNLSANDIYLIKVESSVSKSSEIHTHIHENNMMKMVHIDRLKIPAKSKAVMEAGHDHIMLIKTSKRLKAGDIVNMRFTFDNGNIVEKSIKVKNK